MNFLHYLFAALLITMLLAAITFGADQKSESSKAVDLSTGHTLYAVGYAHLDTQWLWDYPLVLKEYIPNTMHDNFRLFEKYPNYIFNFSGSNRYRMMKEYYPKDYEKVKQYVAAGRWFPCGSSVEECDVMATSAESIIRQVLYGNDYFRKELGKDSAEFILPDCFGFPASLPSLLGHCGLKGFSSQKLTWGSAVGIPFNVGVWDGLDGTSIIAALNPGAYVDQITEDLSHSEAWLKRIDQNGKKSGVFADYHYFGAPGDIGGAPEEDSAKWIEKCVASDGPVRVISSTA
jgi:alpha-mannosidase